jgi:hypothetical protein
MSAVWSIEQQRCLTALGYTLYRSATMPAPGFVPEEMLVQPVAAPATAAMTTKKAIDPLLHALLRAAGLDPAQIDDAQGWLRAQQIPSLTQLRNNPAAKRALWPRLRALRRERATR